MKECTNCKNMVDESERLCPYCGTSFKNPQEPKKKSKKPLLIVLFSLIGVAAILWTVVAVVMFSRCGKSDERTFDIDCAQYTEKMNRLLGSDKLDQNKWKENSGKDGFTYTEESFTIDLGTDKSTRKIKSIKAGPGDKKDGIEIAAASVMVVESALTLDTALDQLADVKDGKREKAVNKESVTTYNKDNKKFTIVPRTPDNEEEASTKEATKATEEKASKVTETKAAPAETTKSPETEPPKTDPPETEPETEEPTTEEPEETEKPDDYETISEGDSVSFSGTMRGLMLESVVLLDEPFSCHLYDGNNYDGTQVYQIEYVQIEGDGIKNMEGKHITVTGTARMKQPGGTDYKDLIVTNAVVTVG